VGALLAAPAVPPTSPGTTTIAELNLFSGYDHAGTEPLAAKLFVEDHPMMNSNAAAQKPIAPIRVNLRK
jgi:hypothetical protein